VFSPLTPRGVGHNDANIPNSARKLFETDTGGGQGQPDGSNEDYDDAWDDGGRDKDEAILEVEPNTDGAQEAEHAREKRAAALAQQQQEQCDAWGGGVDETRMAALQHTDLIPEQRPMGVEAALRIVLNGTTLIEEAATTANMMSTKNPAHKPVQRYLRPHGRPPEDGARATIPMRP
jgi:hypothetical protein